jgi:hypothetical protein
MPLPKSQTMYLTRTSPMMRDRNVEAISRTVAEKAVCAWDGRSIPNARAHREDALADFASWPVFRSSEG